MKKGVYFLFLILIFYLFLSLGKSCYHTASVFMFFGGGGWPRGMKDPSFPARDWTHTLCTGRQSFNHWAAGESQRVCILNNVSKHVVGHNIPSFYQHTRLLREISVRRSLAEEHALLLWDRKCSLGHAEHPFVYTAWIRGSKWKQAGPYGGFPGIKLCRKVCL